MSVVVFTESKIKIVVARKRRTGNRKHFHFVENNSNNRSRTDSLVYSWRWKWVWERKKRNSWKFQFRSLNSQPASTTSLLTKTLPDVDTYIPVSILVRIGEEAGSHHKKREALWWWWSSSSRLISSSRSSSQTNQPTIINSSWFQSCKSWSHYVATMPTQRTTMLGYYYVCSLARTWTHTCTQHNAHNDSTSKTRLDEFCEFCYVLLELDVLLFFRWLGKRG